ncbi:MAG: hypothetical protein AB7D47_13120 [Desulfovibrio sp.]
MNWLKSMFSDNAGGLSSMRMLAAFVVVDVMATWTACCIRSGWRDLSLDTVGLIVGVLGAKAWQRKQEH